MDWIRSFQKSIDYIEDNLTNELSAEEIARPMNISAFYYQRIFTMITGFSVGEYIRGRRLSVAGSELASTDNKIIDIALKYGYDTPKDGACQQDQQNVEAARNFRKEAAAHTALCAVCAAAQLAKCEALCGSENFF